MKPHFKFNEEQSKVFSARERVACGDSGLSENGFSPFEFPESGGKIHSDFRGKFKKR
jgi:hypothetical protein